jgi:hypothetical protein
LQINQHRLTLDIGIETSAHVNKGIDTDGLDNKAQVSMRYLPNKILK